MKKYFLFIIILAIGSASMAQNLEFRLRGGANFQKSNLQDKEYSFLPHFGASAGVRLSTIGIYGELLLSTHEDIGGIETIDYIIPSLHARLYTFRFAYAELGFTYLILSGEVDDISNVDKEAGYFIGLGASFKKFELGFRTASLPETNI